MNAIYLDNGCSAIKRNAVLIHATRMGLENTATYNFKKKLTKDHILYKFHLPRIGKLKRQKKKHQIHGCRREGARTIIKYKVSLWGDRRVVKSIWIEISREWEHSFSMALLLKVTKPQKVFLCSGMELLAWLLHCSMPSTFYAVLFFWDSLWFFCIRNWTQDPALAKQVPCHRAIPLASWDRVLYTAWNSWCSSHLSHPGTGRDHRCAPAFPAMLLFFVLKKLTTVIT